MFTFKLILCLSAFVSVLCCNGYGLSMSYIRNCAGVNSIFKVNHVNVTLDDNCFLNPVGSREIIKDYNTAQAAISVSKQNGRKLNLRFNMCNPQSNPLTTKLFNLVSLPLECPVQKGKMKLQNRQDVNFMKSTFPMVIGKTAIKLNVEHNNGVTCVEADYAVFRK